MRTSIALVVAGTLACRLMLLSAFALEPLQIVSQPKSQTATVGSSASFSVTVSGDSPIYQWWFNGTRIPNGTNAVYTLDNVQTTDAGNYAVVVSNDAVWIASAVVTLTVVSPPTISAIPDQSTDQNKTLGPLSFTITGGSAQPGSLTLTASSSDTNLVPNQNIRFGGTGTNRTVTIVPATNRFGACGITLSVSGADGAVARTSFALVVNHVNQPPELAEEPHLIVKPFQPFSHVFVAHDPDPGDSVQVWAYGLPEWASYDSRTRTLSGVPPLGDPAGTLISLGISDGVTPTQWKFFWIWTEDTIGLTDAADVERKRGELINFIWGEQGWPTNDQFASIESNIADPVYSSLYNKEGNLLRIDRYTVRMDYGLEAPVQHFHPIRSNGRLFLFHAGHHPAGFKGDDVWVNNAGQYPGLVIPRLLKEGYSVLAFEMPIYNPRGPQVVTLPDGRQLALNYHWDILTNLEKPFRFFLEPIVISLNYVQEHYNYRNIYMTGLSGGGWTTTIYAALDPRIERSFPVAGSVPIYLRKGAFEAEQEYAPFYRLANYEELYVMGAHGFNRLQTQILNRYDACCFSGTNSSYWVEDVKQATSSLGEGTYEFFLDETHQEHKTSPVGLSVIMDSLSPTFDEIPDQTIADNAGPHTVPLSGITSALLSRTNAMFITADTDNPDLVGNLTLDYRSPNPTGALSFTTQPGAYGLATVKVTISDGQSVHSTFSRRFTVLVRPAPPVVKLLTPADGTTLQAPQTIQLAAEASSPSGVVEVAFYDGANLLGIVTNQPFSLVWTTATPGTHTLSAVATDDRGAVTTSETAQLTVLPLNQLPLVQWVSPTNSLTLDTPRPVTLEVLANDPDGTVAHVEFLDGTNSLGFVTNSQHFSMTRDHLGPGRHVLSAIVTDNRGGHTESSTVTITIYPANQQPTVEWVAPANGAVFEASEPVLLQASAADPEGRLARVEFFDGTNSLGAVSNPPYSLLWSNATAGTHTLSTVATDDRGAVAISELITVTVAETPLTIQSMQFVALQTPPVTKSTLDLADSQFQLKIAGKDGSIVVVEASADLSNWAPISTNSLLNGTVISADAESRNFNLRFYRVRLATKPPQ